MFYKESIITQPKIGHNKRARTESSTLVSHNKRRNDLTYELDMSVSLDEEHGLSNNPDILEILEEDGRMNSLEFLTKLSDGRNILEELLASLTSDDVDMRLAKDGAHHLLNLLAKRPQRTPDSSNMKRLIDKINSTMYIQQDKERLKDAASTLLSLRKTIVKPELDDESTDKMLVHKAIQSEKCNIVEELVNQGYSSGAADSDGNTVLHLAVLQHCTSCLNTLLKHGVVGVSEENKQGEFNSTVNI